MIDEQTLAKLQKKGIGPTSLMAHHQFQDLCATLTAALKVVRAVQKVKYAGVADFEATHEELNEALKPFKPSDVSETNTPSPGGKEASGD